MKTLEKVIKDAMAANKYKNGFKEVLQSVKSSKLVIVSKSLNAADRAELEEQTKGANVIVYYFPGNSVQLGKLCNKPFRITAIAIKSGTAEELSAVMAERGDAGGR